MHLLDFYVRARLHVPVKMKWTTERRSQSSTGSVRDRKGSSRRMRRRTSSSVDCKSYCKRSLGCRSHSYSSVPKQREADLISCGVMNIHCDLCLTAKSTTVCKLSFRFTESCTNGRGSFSQHGIRLMKRHLSSGVGQLRTRWCRHLEREAQLASNVRSP